MEQYDKPEMQIIDLDLENSLLCASTKSISLYDDSGDEVDSFN